MSPLAERDAGWRPDLDHVRAVSYIRQSKRREDDSKSSPEAQQAKCEALMTSRGWDVAGCFADIGKSGWDPDAQRPELQELMTAVRTGHVDAVVVFSLSRLTRQGAAEAMTIVRELEEHGVRLVSVEEPYLDTSTSMGAAVFGLIAALAQQESDLKSAYVTATKETLRAAGSHVSGVAPYGFLSTRAKRGELTVVKLVPDPREAPHVRDMADWAAGGMSGHAMARRLNESGVPTKNLGERRREEQRRRSMSKPTERTAWTSTTVLRILRDPRLAGYAMTWEGRRARNGDTPGTGGKRVILRDADGAPIVSHEPIIPAEEWWRLQDVLNGRTRVVQRTGRRVPTLLAGHGMLFCDVCGSVMVHDTRQGKRFYKCNRSAGIVPGHGGLVISMVTADDVVSRAVWTRLTTLDCDDPEDLKLSREASRRFARQQDTSETEAEQAAATAELEHVKEALRTLYQDRLEGLYVGETGKGMFRDAVERLTAHERRVSDRLRALDAQTAKSETIPDEWSLNAGDPLAEGSVWSRWDLKQRREFLALFVDSVRITKSAGRGRHANTRERVVIGWAT